jgi:virginiamycin B lyase
MRNLFLAFLFLPALLCATLLVTEASSQVDTLDPTGALLDTRDPAGAARLVAPAAAGEAAPTAVAFVQYSTPVTPTHALVASDGRIWYSSFSGSALGELDPKTLLSRVYTLPEKKSVFDVAQGAGGVIWYTTANAPGGNDTVGRLNPVSGLITEWQLPRNHFGLEVDLATQAVWFVSKGWEKDHLVRLSPQNNQISSWDLSPYTDTYNLDIAPNGDLWFTVQPRGLQGIGRLKVATGETTVWKLPSPEARPFQLQVLSDAEIWLTEFDATGNSISRLTPQTNQLARFLLPHPDSGPGGLLHQGETIWFAEYRGNRVGALAHAAGSPVITTLQTVTFVAPKTTTTVTPATVAPNVSKTLSAVKTVNRRGVLNGAFTEYTLPEAGTKPLDIAPGQGGALWFTESNALRINRLEPLAVEPPETTVFLPIQLR